MSLEYKFEPLDGSFPRDLTAGHLRQSSPFSKTWTETQNLLERELRFLNYRRGTVVLQTAHSARDVRKDGQLYADVRKPEHPGVVIKFNVYNSQSKQIEAMSFECDQFADWKSNVRAIADALEALRKVNRYGVSGGGKTEAHYEGFKALPEPKPDVQKAREAADFIAKYSDYPPHSLTSPANLARAYRQAAVKLHPDKGGSDENFVRLQNAKAIMEGFFNK
jgi:hypothetical protein